MRWRSCDQANQAWSIPICAGAKVSEPVIYPKPELEQVLGKTLGVPLFPEQAMRASPLSAQASHLAGMSQLRENMATFKFTGGVSAFRDKLIAGMVANGYEPEFAAQTFSQLGFGGFMDSLNLPQPLCADRLA